MVYLPKLFDRFRCCSASASFTSFLPDLRRRGMRKLSRMALPTRTAIDDDFLGDSAEDIDIDCCSGGWLTIFGMVVRFGGADSGGESLDIVH